MRVLMDDERQTGPRAEVRSHALDRIHRAETVTKFLRVVEQTADSVLITDRDGRIEYVNPAFEALTGYPAAEVMGRTPRLLKSGTYDQAFYEGLWKTILSGQVYRGTLRNKRRNGVLFYWEQTITPLKDRHGVITHFVSTARDVTERQRLEALKDEMISLVSHELRSPLMAIHESIALLARGTVGAPTAPQQEMLDVALRNLGRLRSLLDHLLDVSKLEAGRLALTLEWCDLGAVAQEAARMFQALAQKQGIALNVTLPQGGLQVRADREKLLEVFTNLISNAIKFTERGSVEVAVAEAGGGEGMGRVSDTGPGIAPEDLPKVFGKFQQLSAPARHGEKGTGLGLAICKGLIELHGGRIWVESQVGRGTTFTFAVPKAGPEPR